MGEKEQQVRKADIEAMLDRGVCPWPRWRKTHLTQAMRMDGPFTVQTKEGELRCPDGYLAIDADGWPYPIATEDFERMYEPVEGAVQVTGPPAPDLDLTTAIKLASLVVHVQEASGPGGHELDIDTAYGLASDPAVTDWLAKFDPALLPVKRNG